MNRFGNRYLVSSSLADLSLAGPQYGANAPGTAPVADRPRYVRITDIDEAGNLRPEGAKSADFEDSDEYTLSEGDLLFARSGNTVGKTYLYRSADGPCTFAGYLIRFRLNQEKILPKLAFYFTKTVEYGNWITSRQRVGGQPNINGQEYAALEIPHPTDLREQARIVELLDQADALRRQRAEADAKLARLLPALFRHHFGDPAQNPMKFRTARLRSLAQRYSDGPFGSNLKSDHYSPTGVRVIRLQNIGVGELLDDDKAYISEEHFALLDKHQCLPGDVLIGTMGDPNLRACIQPQSLKVALNKADCVQFRADVAQCTAEYICWLLNNPSTLGMAGSMVAGQTRARISMGRLGELEVPVPPLDLQKRFSQQVKLSNPLLTHAAASAAKLETLFQTLLHRAFTGELTAKWREAHLREGVQEITRAARS